MNNEMTDRHNLAQPMRRQRERLAATSILAAAALAVAAIVVLICVG